MDIQVNIPAGSIAITDTTQEAAAIAAVREALSKMTGQPAKPPPSGGPDRDGLFVTLEPEDVEALADVLGHIDDGGKATERHGDTSPTSARTFRWLGHRAGFIRGEGTGTEVTEAGFRWLGEHRPRWRQDAAGGT